MIGEDKSVAQLNDGTTTLLFFNLPVYFKAANVNNIDDEPELTNTEYFVPILLAHFSSSSTVNSPFPLSYIYCPINFCSFCFRSSSSNLSYIASCSSPNIPFIDNFCYTFLKPLTPLYKRFFINFVYKDIKE
jgi:hypothetical protein